MLLIGIIFALLGLLGLGVGDFLAGISSRKIGVIGIVVGLILLSV